MLEDPPPPVHESVYTLSPGKLTATSSLPLNALLPDQDPEAVQDVVLVEVQVRFVEPPTKTEVCELEKVITGIGSGALPPPPHEDNRKMNAKTYKWRII